MKTSWSRYSGIYEEFISGLSSRAPTILGTKMEKIRKAKLVGAIAILLPLPPCLESTLLEIIFANTIFVKIQGHQMKVLLFFNLKPFPQYLETQENQEVDKKWNKCVGKSFYKCLTFVQRITNISVLIILIKFAHTHSNNDLFRQTSSIDMWCLYNSLINWLM